MIIYRKLTNLWKKNKLDSITARWLVLSNSRITHFNKERRLWKTTCPKSDNDWLQIYTFVFKNKVSNEVRSDLMLQKI